MEYSGRCPHGYAISIVVLVHISASLSLFHHHANATRCVDREREALLAIKQDLVDEGDLLSSWGSGSEAQKQDCCRWERLYCDNQTGHVLQLHLGSAYSSDNNRFAGELPSSLKNCTNLRAVDLESNELSGPIPKWLGVEVSKLAILILRSNHFNGSMPSQLCHLRSIQVLDLSMNNISGSIPKCLNNLTTLAQKGNPDLTISHNYTSLNGSTMWSVGIYDDEVSIMWKGIFAKYKNTLGLVKSIDLSSNRLTGEIPSAITDLVGLVSLNLSRNHLTGQITLDIGKLQSLDSLDISRNQIHGAIPTSLARIDRLAYLDLSYNDLSGEIPTGTQLQGFDPSVYAGNPQLCGLPLERTRDPEGTSRPNVSSNQEDHDELIMQDFYISLGLGFAVGFWGVCGSLIFKRSWRYAYYKFLNASNDWLYVKVALIRRQLKDVLN